MLSDEYSKIKEILQSLYKPETSLCDSLFVNIVEIYLRDSSYSYLQPLISEILDKMINDDYKIDNWWTWEWIAENFSLDNLVDVVGKKYNLDYYSVENYSGRKTIWDMISSSHVLSYDDLIRFIDKINFYRLLMNPNLSFDIDLEFLAKYEEKVMPKYYRSDFANESNNIYKSPYVKWNEEILEYFYNSLNWEYLSQCDYLPWSFEFLCKYESNWDWKEISRNEEINFTLEVLEKYDERLDWETLSWNKFIIWTPYILNKYKNKICWRRLELQTTIPQEIIRDYFVENSFQIEDTLDLNDPSFIKSVFDFFTELDTPYWKRVLFPIDENTIQGLNDESLRNYKDRISFDRQSLYEKYSFTEEFVDLVKDQLNWSSFCKFSDFFNSERISKYKDKINWSSLTRNEKLTIDTCLKEEFKDNWDYTVFQLSENEILKHIEQFKLDELIINKSIEKTPKIIEYVLHNLGFLIEDRTTVMPYLKKTNEENIWLHLSLCMGCFSDNLFIENIDNWIYKEGLFKNDSFYNNLVLTYLSVEELRNLLSKHTFTKVIKDDTRELMDEAEKTYSLDADYVFQSGRYKGHVLKEVFENDFNYIMYCLINLESFCIDYNLFYQYGNEKIYKPYTDIEVIKVYEKAITSNPRLLLPWCLNEYYDQCEADRREREKEESWRNEANDIFYREFGGDFHPDML